MDKGSEEKKLDCMLQNNFKINYKLGKVILIRDILHGHIAYLYIFLKPDMFKAYGYKNLIFENLL